MPLTNFTRRYPQDAPLPSAGLWFIANQHGIIVSKQQKNVQMPSGAWPLSAMVQPAGVLMIGEAAGVPCLACNVPDDVTLPESFRAFSLRDLYGHVDDLHYAIAGYATQLLHWQRSSNFCTNCGNPLDPIAGEWGKRCPRCGFTTYPPVNPCTITLVHDGERILMTHKRGWGARYGLVAGFVEPGETLEENVAREIEEETGVAVRDIQYWRSQPWPFPHQLMCGFYAQYAGGEVKIDGVELDNAQWFTVADLRAGKPDIPPPLSIARQLIDNWLAQFG